MHAFNNLKYIESQLVQKQNDINDLELKLGKKTEELEYYKKFLVTTNEYNSLVSGLYHKEQIMTTKFNNLMKELAELQEENDFIRDQMIEKGFQPFHETLSNNTVYGEPDETREESPQATSEASEERAFTETVTEANQQTDSEY
jgi:ribonuclease HIII